MSGQIGVWAWQTCIRKFTPNTAIFAQLAKATPIQIGLTLASAHSANHRYHFAIEALSDKGLSGLVANAGFCGHSAGW